MQISAEQIQAAMAIISVLMTILGASNLMLINYIVSRNNDRLVNRLSGQFYAKQIGEERFRSTEEKLNDIQKRIDLLEKDVREVYNEINHPNRKREDKNAN